MAGSQSSRAWMMKSPSGTSRLAPQRSVEKRYVQPRQIVGYRTINSTGSRRSLFSVELGKQVANVSPFKAWWTECALDLESSEYYINPQSLRQICKARTGLSTENPPPPIPPTWRMQSQQQQKSGNTSLCPTPTHAPRNVCVRTEIDVPRGTFGVVTSAECATFGCSGVSNKWFGAVAQGG